MPRLTADQWETVRAEREAGSSFRELESRHGVSHQAIVKRAKAEGWSNGEDVQAIIRRKVAEKVAGFVAEANPVKKAAALNDAADRTAEVIRRHQEETNAVRERLYAGLRTHKSAQSRDEKLLAFEDLKAAKISSETVLNIHRAERQAWGIDDAAAQPTIVIERSFGRPAQ